MGCQASSCWQDPGFIQSNVDNSLFSKGNTS